MADVSEKRPPRIPPRGRAGVFVPSPFVLAYGVWAMISGRIGRGPTPIEGTPAVVLGAVFAAFAVLVWLACAGAWHSQAWWMLTS
jgi:hypothetical protein